MSNCQKPGCTRNPSDTYSDEHGNGLELCSKHYYELVSGTKVREKTLKNTAIGFGQELGGDIDRGTGGGSILDFDPVRGGSGTTPCPDCGKPMGMVTWTGAKPSCHRCQENVEIPTPWLGVIDPNGGEPLGPTMDVGIRQVESDGDFPLEFRAQVE